MGSVCACGMQQAENLRSCRGLGFLEQVAGDNMSIKKQSSIALNALGSAVTASACTHLHSLRRLLHSVSGLLLLTGSMEEPQAAYERP